MRHCRTVYSVSISTALDGFDQSFIRPDVAGKDDVGHPGEAAFRTQPPDGYAGQDLTQYLYAVCAQSNAGYVAGRNAALRNEETRGLRNAFDGFNKRH